MLNRAHALTIAPDHEPHHFVQCVQTRTANNKEYPLSLFTPFKTLLTPSCGFVAEDDLERAGQYIRGSPKPERPAEAVGGDENGKQKLHAGAVATSGD